MDITVPVEHRRRLPAGHSRGQRRRFCRRRAGAHGCPARCHLRAHRRGHHRSFRLHPHRFRDHGDIVNYGRGHRIPPAATASYSASRRPSSAASPTATYDIDYGGVPFYDTNTPTHHSWAFFPDSVYRRRWTSTVQARHSFHHQTCAVRRLHSPALTRPLPATARRRNLLGRQLQHLSLRRPVRLEPVWPRPQVQPDHRRPSPPVARLADPEQPEPERGRHQGGVPAVGQVRDHRLLRRYLGGCEHARLLGDPLPKMYGVWRGLQLLRYALAVHERASIPSRARVSTSCSTNNSDPGALPGHTSTTTTMCPPDFEYVDVNKQFGQGWTPSASSPAPPTDDNSEKCSNASGDHGASSLRRRQGLQLTGWGLNSGISRCAMRYHRHRRRALWPSLAAWTSTTAITQVW